MGKQRTELTDEEALPILGYLFELGQLHKEKSPLERAEFLAAYLLETSLSTDQLRSLYEKLRPDHLRRTITRQNAAESVALAVNLEMRK